MTRELHVIVHGLDQARAAVLAARDAGVAVCLHSAPDAALNAGCGWWRGLVDAAREIVPGVAVRSVLDCGMEPGIVLAALRAGVRHIRFYGTAAQEAQLRDIAKQLDACIESTGPPPATLDLARQSDPARACRQWLGD